MGRPKIKIVTLGCSKNTVDSEKLIKQLELNGNKVVYDGTDAASDIVIINTCGFINDAKEESIDTILKFAQKKAEGKIKKLYVTGCLSQRYGAELRDEIPEVDSFFGVNESNNLLKELNFNFDESVFNQRTLTGPSHYAYLKISEGCDRKCAFCAIPGIRGQYQSQPLDCLLNEATILAEMGVKELILIAQDLSYYGFDTGKRNMLPKLVDKLLGLDRFEWIRLHYLYPTNFSWDIIEIMRNNPSLCRYIDIPIQHISDNMLSSMKRSHNRKETEEILYRIRYDIPEAAIRTTLITGFPGETEKDFSELYDFIKEFRFDRLGVFTYSHEEGTPAYKKMIDDIPQKIKEERASILMELQQTIALDLNESKINKVYNTIIDRKEGEYYIGRTEFDSPEVDQEVLIKTDHNLKIGKFYGIKITQSSDFDLFGIPI
jgi:ribosomal protein S12 methylthiotransferase